MLACVVAPGAGAQAWRAEQQRIDAEAAGLIEDARQRGETDLSGISDALERLQAEYVVKVVRPALTQARTCRERMSAVELAISVERQAQLFGMSSILDSQEISSLMSGTYGDETYERCMNELYRACVVEDNPLFALTMAAWTLGYERQKQLLGTAGDAALSLDSELDPRITKCRGPWYQVRITVERSGTEPDLGPWHDKDLSTGWLGRGLSRRAPAGTRHPGVFERRAEQRGYGARCPDGGCGESCSFLAVVEGPARVEYELEASHAYRMLNFGFVDEDGEETLEANSCPHTDLPVSLYPGTTFTATFPADVVAPLTDDPSFTGGADPKVTEAFDEWPRMFGSWSIELEVHGEPTGRLEVQRTCDGQELWGRGSAECQQKWNEYLEAFGHEMPLAPWDRTPRAPE